MIKNGYLVCPCLIGGSMLTYNVNAGTLSSNLGPQRVRKLRPDEDHYLLHACTLYLPQKT